MFSKLVIALAFSSITLQGVIAQDINSLPTCVLTCLASLPPSCITLGTPCICTSRVLITPCIRTTCTIEDLSASNAIFGSLCAPALPSLPIPVPTLPTPPQPTVTPVPKPPPTQPPQPSAVVAPTPSPSPIIPTPAPVISPTPSITDTPETVVVFSTQFAPPEPLDSAQTSASSSLSTNYYITLVITGVVASFVGIHIF